MEREDLALSLSRRVDEWAERNFGGQPDWEPLKRVLPQAWVDGFMWMGRVQEGGNVIELFKHGITRRYLNLDGGGQAYQFNGSGYRPIDFASAIDDAFAGLEATGWTRETIYDDEFILRRNRALAGAGWTVITGGPSQSANDEKPDPSNEDNEAE